MERLKLVHYRVRLNFWRGNYWTNCCSMPSTNFAVFLFVPQKSTMRVAMVGFLVLVMGAAVKAHIHFIRLALLAAMGLAGMWMMHKLAQDWQKISSRPKPMAMAGKLLGLWKRSIDEAVSTFNCWHRYVRLIMQEMEIIALKTCSHAIK